MTKSEFMEANDFVPPGQRVNLGCIGAEPKGLLWIEAQAEKCAGDSMTKFYCQQYLKWPPVAAALEAIHDDGRDWGKY